MLSPLRNISAITARAAAVLTLALIAAAVVPAANAQESLLVNNGPFATNEAWNCTNFSIADDFTLTAPVTISTIRFWALDFSEAQNFGNFSGTMSWFIHSSNDINRPGAPIASGFSSGIAVTDTGLTHSGDVVKIFQMDIPADDLQLDTGTYWLHLKEGTPTDTSDSTPILWAVRNGQSGQALRFDPNPVNPTDWASDGGSKDLSFQMFSPFETPMDAPEPGTFALFLMAALPFTCAARLRMRRIKHEDQGL